MENLRLEPREQTLAIPKISVLLGGTPQQAAGQMRRVYPKATKLGEASRTVGSTTVEAIWQAAFVHLFNDSDLSCRLGSPAARPSNGAHGSPLAPAVLGEVERRANG